MSDQHHPSQDPDSPTENDSRAAEKVRSFPHTPGVYLMKDASGVVIYVGKAKDLRSRAGSYFLKAALEDARTGSWVPEIRDIDYIEAESEVDALLMESRLIKDIQPKFNRIQKDGKTFPYIEIATYDQFPRVRVTRTPRPKGVKLYGPFPSAHGLRGALQVLQKIFKFRTCSLDIQEDEERWKWFRPCLLASIDQCSAPCNLQISKDDYRKNIRRLQRFLSGDKKGLLRQLKREMAQAAEERRYEDAAELRNEIAALETLDQRGSLEKHVQPEVFPIDPKKGLAGLQKILHLDERPRTIEGVDIAHISGRDTVASLVQFIDGLPFKPGYKRYKIRTVEGVDDFASIHEVVFRRFSRLLEKGEAFPDILLVDGGRGQFNAARKAFERLGCDPPILLSLAKRDEELYFSEDEDPLTLGRRSYALRLLQYVRDESHRFAQHYHHILRRKSTLGEP
jgi:excinuclease ABC subunit C